MNSVKAGDEQDDHFRRLFLEVAQSLVDDGEEIIIEVLPAGGFSTFKVRASPAAISLLVGPKGQMARALRTLLAGSGAKLGRRYALDLENREGNRNQ